MACCIKTNVNKKLIKGYDINASYAYSMTCEMPWLFEELITLDNPLSIYDIELVSYYLYYVIPNLNTGIKVSSFCERINGALIYFSKLDKPCWKWGCELKVYKDFKLGEVTCYKIIKYTPFKVFD